MDDQPQKLRGRPRTGEAWLVPVLKVDDEWTPEIDRALTAVALAARAGSQLARNALYEALAAKIARFVGRYRFRQPVGAAWEIADVEQEAFLVLVDLIGAWSGEGGFARYFLGYFPWRLATAVRLLNGPRITTPLSAVEALLHDDSAVAEEARALLEALAADLPPADQLLLLLHVRDGERFGTIARRLLVSRRTVTRRWQALCRELRQTLEPPAVP